MVYSSFRSKFANIEEMDEYIVSSWNELIKDKDIVYHLGDVGFANSSSIIPIVQRLNGKKRLVSGNHDARLVKFLKKNSDAASLFDEVHESYHEISISKTTFVLCHYPIYSWNRRRYGAIHLHGHMHGMKGEGYPDGKIMDVGIDTHPTLLPYSLDQVMEVLDGR